MPCDLTQRAPLSSNRSSIVPLRSPGVKMRDADVREAVRGRLSAHHQNDDTTRIVEEMGLWAGAVRIDIAVINGELAGYELKSDRDTLERLPAQADIYSRVLDRVTLVAGSRHLDKSSAMIPDWWGIISAELNRGRVTLASVRKAERNPAIEPYLVAELLWREEAIELLEQHALANAWRSKPMKAIHERLAAELTLDSLRLGVRNALKRRPARLRQVRGGQRQVAI
jgi:hypothetical protein